MVSMFSAFRMSGHQNVSNMESGVTGDAWGKRNCRSSKGELRTIDEISRLDISANKDIVRAAFDVAQVEKRRAVIELQGHRW